MVAMAILGVAIVTLFQLFSIALRSQKKAEDYTRAVFHARALLDESYAVPEISDVTDTFEFEDGMKGSRIAMLRDESGTELYEITVRITWDPSGSLELKGIRAITPDEPEK
jgi:Tfp pilus assembly protein PilV